MAESLSTQSLRSAFVFPFQSKDWISRFVIGVALIFAGLVIPILPGLFVYGYLIQVMRQTIQGEPLVLPAWTHWGKLFKDGLKSLAVVLVFLGPAIIVGFIGFAAYLGLFASSIALSPDSSSASAGLFAFLMLGSMGTLFLSMFVGWFLMFLGAIPLPAAVAHFAARDKLGAAFHVREWTSIIGADKWGYLIAWVVTLGLFGLIYVGFMLFYFTFIFCFVAYLVAFPIGFYVMLVTAAVFGQFYREGAGLAAARSVKPASAPEVQGA